MRTNQSEPKAFTLVEALVVVAVIAILGGIAAVNVVGARESSSEAKLRSDVRIINSAIDVYLASGGNAAQLTDANSALRTLKSRATNAASVTGVSGAFIDPRTKIVTQSPAEGSSAALRAFFTNSPEPRFYTAKSGGAGIKMFVFDEVAEEVAEEEREVTLAQTSEGWLWDYAVPTLPAAPSAAQLVPLTQDSLLTNAGAAIFQLTPPLISPSGGRLPLTQYPLPVTVSGSYPPGAWRIYTSVDGATWTTNLSLTVEPDTDVSAAAVSFDPSRFSSSATAVNQYTVEPFALNVTVAAPSTLTYAQAGGAISNQAALATNQLPTATISLNLAGLNAKYISSAYFKLRYTWDGSNPLTSTNATAANPPTFTGSVTPVTFGVGLSAPAGMPLASWGTNSTLPIWAVAQAIKTNWFVSGTNQSPVAISPMVLSLSVAPTAPIGLPKVVAVTPSGSLPVGLRVFWTASASGQNPLSSEVGGYRVGGEPYTGPVTNSGLPASTYTFVAQATGPSGREQWFSSPAASRTYTVVTVVPPRFVGLNVFSGDINGTLKGSIYLQYGGSLSVFNAAGEVLGNVYLPGTPGIAIPGPGGADLFVVNRGQPYDPATDDLISSRRIAGIEFTTNGTKAVPQLDLRKIVDLGGSVLPNDYDFKLTTTSFIEGKVYRRGDPPPIPPAPVLPSGVSTTNTALTITNQFYLGPSSNNAYLNTNSYFVTMNNTNAVLVLGQSNGIVPIRYVFAGGNWSAGRVEILGPVELYFTDGFDNAGVTFGSSNMVAKTFINVLSNKPVDLNGTTYGVLDARGSVVQVESGGVFYGSVLADNAKVAKNGVLDVLEGSLYPTNNLP
jgi:prepilin-type N-terminal cleavage/methylation domain-containing protein